MRTIHFIINPISGGTSKAFLPDLIGKTIDKNKFQYQIHFTDYPGHAKVLAREAIASHADIVVAVGGDGTINEIATELIHTKVALGIVPKGSGNGLARHLNIPLKTEEAIAYLNQASSQLIDVGQFNERFFFCASGVGFDAHVSAKFASLTKRGLWGYVKTSISSFLDYKCATYRLKIDGVPYAEHAFMVTIANAAQFGNNVFIAPLADVQDGWLDVCIMKPFRFWEIPIVSLRLFSKTIYPSRYIKIIKAKNIEIMGLNSPEAHIDGESIFISDNLVASIHPKALWVMT